MNEVRVRQNELLAQADKTAEQIVSQARDAAKSEADKILAQARESTETERENLMREVRREAALLSVEVARKVIRADLSSEYAQNELLERFVAEVEDGRKAGAGNSNS